MTINVLLVKVEKTIMWGDQNREISSGKMIFLPLLYLLLKAWIIRRRRTMTNFWFITTVKHDGDPLGFRVHASFVWVMYPSYYGIRILYSISSLQCVSSLYVKLLASWVKFQNCRDFEKDTWKRLTFKALQLCVELRVWWKWFIFLHLSPTKFDRKWPQFHVFGYKGTIQQHFKSRLFWKTK